MELHKTPRLRNQQMQSFTQSVLDICSPVETLRPYVLLVNDKFEFFVTGMQKEKISRNRKSFDEPRDLYCCSFFDALEIEMDYPKHDEQTQSTLQSVAEKATKYGKKIARLPMDEESAAIDNLLEEMETVDLTPLEGTGLTRWLTLMAETNEVFKAITTLGIEKEAEATTILAASNVTTELEACLNTLFKQLFAQCITAPSEELAKVDREIATLIKEL